MRLAPLLLVLGLVRPLGAQTVRPAVVEYSEQARGKFELVNETLFPLTVVLEPRGFHVEPSGDLIEEPLDTDAHAGQDLGDELPHSAAGDVHGVLRSHRQELSVVVSRQQHPDGSAHADRAQCANRAAARRVHAAAASRCERRM